MIGYLKSVVGVAALLLLVACGVAGSEALAQPGSENLDIALVRNGKPVHNLICLPNSEADPAAVLALKEYRAFVKKATGTEPTRVEKPVSGTPSVAQGRLILH